MTIEIEKNFAPSKIVCVGRNYAEHAAEMGNDVPKEPLLFLKAPSSLLLPRSDATPADQPRHSTTPSSDYHPVRETRPPLLKPGGELEPVTPQTGGEPAIVIPSQSNQVEHEGELAVIIGHVCKSLSDDDDPWKYVLGYTCLNDVTARDIQRRDVQFTRGKSFDTFCPIGPHIETELDVADLRVTTRVNGVIKQDGRTSQMVFPVDFLIRYISNMMTLLPGDVIATGTPSGVSKLNSGDMCEVEIEGIGVLRNSVV